MRLYPFISHILALHVISLLFYFCLKSFVLDAVSTDPIAKQLRTGTGPSAFPPLSSNGAASGSMSDLSRGVQVSPSPFLGQGGQGGLTPELIQQAGLMVLQQQQQQQILLNQPRPPAMNIPPGALQPGFPPQMPFGVQPASSRAAYNGGINEPQPIMDPFTALGEPPSPGADTSGEGGGQRYSGGDKGNRGKSARQQEANKIAQQRYRERKKQKFEDMAKQVELLRQELSQLQSVQARNQILEGMNNDLQRALVDREREVERLKVELDTHADASIDNASEDSENIGGERGGGGGGSRPNGRSESFQTNLNVGLNGLQINGNPVNANGAAREPSLGRNMSVPCDFLPRNLSGIDFEAGFSQQIELLKEFMKKHKLESSEVSVDDVPLDVMGDLAQLVGTSCQLCQAAIRAEGARVLELIAGDPSQLSSAEHPAHERFHKALEAMQMSPEQEEQLLLFRTAHLTKMREIYAERQALNLEAMALMLPHHSRNPAEDNTLEGKMENISNFGYLPVAKSNAELAKVLDAIKDNLRREQRSAMDINCATVSKVLNPLQAAHYMVAVFPQHCDALALSNVLAHKLGRELKGGASNASVAALCAGASCCP